MSKIPAVTRLHRAIIRILGCNPYARTIQGTNTYLLGTGKKRILIDTGDADVTAYIEHLSCLLRDENATISTILLTHWHPDHVGGLKNIMGTYMVDPDCKVYKFPLPADSIANRAVDIPDNVKVLEIKNKQIFAVDGIDVRVEHAPGHTEDHIMLMAGNSILFSGDCVVFDGTPSYEHFSDYISNLQKILQLRPRLVYPSHGNVITRPITKIRQILNGCMKLEERILKLFQEAPHANWEVMEIVKVIFKKSPRCTHVAATVKIQDHVDKLIADGKIQLVANSLPPAFRLSRSASTRSA